jgi:hypothetical protein
VEVKGKSCRDVVTLTFRPDKGAPPLCSVSYKPGPFSEDASGKPVTVAGTAFLVVRCDPAYSYDPLSGQTTYVAPANKHTVPQATKHVVDLVETGDFEGVMSWVIGLDGQRPFHVNATAGGALVIAVY